MTAKKQCIFFLYIYDLKPFIIFLPLAIYIFINNYSPRRQGVHRADGHDDRVAVDLVSYAPPVLNRGQQGE